MKYSFLALTYVVWKVCCCCYIEVTKFCTLQGHSDQLFSVEWSQCGRYLASVCKDGKIRIFEPRKSTLPISEGGEIVPKKGARISWVLDGQYLIVTGFSKYVYKLIYLLTAWTVKNDRVCHSKWICTICFEKKLH